MTTAPGPRGKRKLRVGLLLDSTSVARWVADIVQSVVASDHSEIAVAVVNETTRSKRLPPFRHALYELYSRVDRRLFMPARDPFGSESLLPLLDAIPRQTGMAVAPIGALGWLTGPNGAGQKPVVTVAVFVPRLSLIFI